MKKVLIVSCYFQKNYGSMLQAYATQNILDNMNIENETVNIDENVDFKNGKRKFYLTQLTNFKFIKAKMGMIKLKFDKIFVKGLGEKIGIRTKKYQEFRKNFRLTKPYKTYAELSEICKNYSDVLVGSDQLWLPVNVVADYYTLNWVPEDINKISLATSFGFATIEDKYKDRYKTFLSRIQNLSVREASGVQLVKDITGRTASLVCDPTLLLTKEEWMKIQSKERIINDKYILCYFLGSNIEHRKFAERLKKETGCKIVSLNHADEYVKYSDIFADETPYDIGPKEFLNLVRNAEYVCTDSFHGTVFSLINDVKFFTFRRYNSKSKFSTNSRIDSLLDIAGLKDRLIYGTEDVKLELAKQINFDDVNLKIEKFREDSKNFLKNALNIGDKND